ncbi:hypothetical protein EG329_001362 [Mollisiaceae sp. DMI_Dod_QoI]|nr:hypothetical protein EG329_001362 [Helotiales sp. DMI_Dod_QoI]
MACKLPSNTLRRAQLPSPTCCAQQTRHATLLRRPHRPYTFTQLITLSDGSTYTARTTSPAPIFRSTKDTRNHPLWQPSLDSLRNIEQDEAGRLRAFRERFGRGWDLDSEVIEEGTDAVVEGSNKVEVKSREGRDDGGESLMDLISGGAYSGGGEEKAKKGKK